MSDKLQAPFPYFGGKSRIANIVWQALGDCDHYLEPFFGSGAVLLSRPNYEPSRQDETITDADGNIANVWRAIKSAPDEVAKVADWPVNMVDYHARHAELQRRQPDMLGKLLADPNWYDVELAGWWIWGQSTGIGRSWGQETLGSIPDLSNRGSGIHRPNIDIRQLLASLSQRLRRVRVCYGDWKITLGGNWQKRKWDTLGMFLDPPYGEKAKREKRLYRKESVNVSEEVLEYCKLKTDSSWRIVLAGYDGEHNILESMGWRVLAWKTNGGYANQNPANKNKSRERLWMSPACLRSSAISGL